MVSRIPIWQSVLLRGADPTVVLQVSNADPFVAERLLCVLYPASRVGHQNIVRPQYQWLGTKVGWRRYGKILGMIGWLRHLLGWTISAFRSGEDLVLENLALRQQLLALHAHRPRQRLTAAHKLFWVALQRLWSRWKEPLILVTPRTVVGWHRAGFLT